VKQKIRSTNDCEAGAAIRSSARGARHGSTDDRGSILAFRNQVFFDWGGVDEHTFKQGRVDEHILNWGVDEGYTNTK